MATCTCPVSELLSPTGGQRGHGVCLQALPCIHNSYSKLQPWRVPAQELRARPWGQVPSKAPPMHMQAASMPAASQCTDRGSHAGSTAARTASSSPGLWRAPAWRPRARPTLPARTSAAPPTLRCGRSASRGSPPGPPPGARDAQVCLEPQTCAPDADVRYLPASAPCKGCNPPTQQQRQLTTEAAKHGPDPTGSFGAASLHHAWSRLVTPGRPGCSEAPGNHRFPSPTPLCWQAAEGCIIRPLLLASRGD